MSLVSSFSDPKQSSVGALETHTQTRTQEKQTGACQLAANNFVCSVSGLQADMGTDSAHHQLDDISGGGGGGWVQHSGAGEINHHI